MFHEEKHDVLLKNSAKFQNNKEYQIKFSQTNL